MNKKLETAVKLLQTENPAKEFQGLCLILEVEEETPDQLDPVVKALVAPFIKKIVKATENSLGIQVFDT